jgi:hypothetical protein
MHFLYTLKVTPEERSWLFGALRAFEARVVTTPAELRIVLALLQHAPTLAFDLSSQEGAVVFRGATAEAVDQLGDLLSVFLQTHRANSCLVVQVHVLAPDGRRIWRLLVITEKHAEMFDAESLGAPSLPLGLVDTRYAGAA